MQTYQLIALTQVANPVSAFRQPIIDVFPLKSSWSLWTLIWSPLYKLGISRRGIMGNTVTSLVLLFIQQKEYCK